MTTAGQTQYDPFLAHGYNPDIAAQLIARGAWLGTLADTAEDVSAAREYRRERDARSGERQRHPVGRQDNRSCSFWLSRFAMRSRVEAWAVGGKRISASSERRGIAPAQRALSKVSIVEAAL
jgi:hypothetical protein